MYVTPTSPPPPLGARNESLIIHQESYVKLALLVLNKFHRFVPQHCNVAIVLCIILISCRMYTRYVHNVA